MNFNIQLGDLLYRTKGIVQHVGVYLGNGQVAHNSPTNGTELVDFEMFSNGEDIKVVHINFDNRHLLVERLEQLMAMDGRYNAIRNNCEHLATYLISGRASSSQLRGIAGGAVLFGLFFGRGRSASETLGLMALGGIAGGLLTNLARKYDRTVTHPNKYELLT